MSAKENTMSNSKQKVRCLIVDDEQPAVGLLTQYVEMVDGFEVTAFCYSAVKAREILKVTEVDLIFMDIRMPVLSGIDLIKTLRNPPAIVLTTAYREYALDGYDLDIIDYLLKPIKFDRFLKACQRYEERNDTRQAPQSNAQDNEDHFYVNVNKTHHKIVFADILYIESLKDYVRIHTTTEKLVVKGNIGSFMNQLPEQLFVRTHRSYIICLKHVKAYNQTDIEVGEKSIPIGVSHRKELMERLS